VTNPYKNTLGGWSPDSTNPQPGG